MLGLLKMSLGFIFSFFTKLIFYFERKMYGIVPTKITIFGYHYNTPSVNENFNYATVNLAHTLSQWIFLDMFSSSILIQKFYLDLVTREKKVPSFVHTFFSKYVCTWMPLNSPSREKCFPQSCLFPVTHIRADT